MYIAKSFGKSKGSKAYISNKEDIKFNSIKKGYMILGKPEKKTFSE